MSYPEYPNTSGRIPCAEWPCGKCDEAGRTSWRSRVVWHTEKLRRRARLRRLALRALGSGIACAFAAVVVVAIVKLVTS